MSFCLSISTDDIGWKYYIVYIVWLAFETVFLYFFLVETKGRSLEETAALFDGKEAENTLHDAVTAAVAPTHHDNVSVEKDSVEHVG